MKIEKILNQHRRDFTALYKCEHCGDISEGPGYDDSYFHEHVVPDMECKECGRKADDSYRPLSTKYPDSERR